MTLRSIALAGLLALVATLPVSAEEVIPEYGTTREGAARAAQAGARVKALEEDNLALRAENAELRAGRDAALKLVEITEKVVAAQERLTQLAEQERDAYKAKAERLEKDRRASAFWPTVEKRAAEGALIGAVGGSVMPGVGNVLGGLGGAVVGGIAGAIEALVSGL